MHPYCSMMLNSLVTLVMSFGPPILKTFAGITSVPVALRLRSLFIIIIIFYRLIGLCQLVELQAMAASLMDEGIFRTLSECSVHLFKILSLSVKSVLPSGNAPDDCGVCFSGHCRSIWSCCCQHVCIPSAFFLYQLPIISWHSA